MSIKAHPGRFCLKVTRLDVAHLSVSIAKNIKELQPKILNCLQQQWRKSKTQNASSPAVNFTSKGAINSLIFILITSRMILYLLLLSCIITAVTLKGEKPCQEVCVISQTAHVFDTQIEEGPILKSTEIHIHQFTI